MFLEYLCDKYFSSVQSLSRVRLFVTPWTAAHQVSLPITNSQSLLKLVSIESVMPSNHLILCHPLILLPSIFPSIRIFSNELVLHIRWPKNWTFSFSIRYLSTINTKDESDTSMCLQCLTDSESCSVVSDSFWPHGLYSPWNPPGQNTGVGCCC